MPKVIINNPCPEGYTIATDGTITPIGDGDGGGSGAPTECWAMDLPSFPIEVVSYNGTPVGTVANDIGELTALIDPLEAAGTVANDGTALTLDNIPVGASLGAMVYLDGRTFTENWVSVPCA